MTLVLLTALALALSLPLSARGAAPNNGSAAPGKHVEAVKNPTIRTAGTRSPAPVPTATPLARTPLSEPHEYEYELAREQNSLNKAYAAGGARFIIGLMWPIICLVALLLAADLVRRWLATRGAADAPITNAVLERAVAANAQFSVPATDLARVNTAAEVLAAEFQALMPNAPPSPMAMLAFPVPAGAPAPLTDARADVEQYAERVFRIMVSSQYGLLALAAGRSVTYGEATSIYADAQTNGYSATVATWIDVLVRTGLLRSVAAGASVNTVVAATDLGRMFLGWCDAQAYGKVSFARLGRGI